MSQIGEHIDTWEAEGTELSASLYKNPRGQYELWLKNGAAMIQVAEHDIENLIELADLSIGVIKRRNRYEQS